MLEDITNGRVRRECVFRDHTDLLVHDDGLSADLDCPEPSLWSAALNSPQHYRRSLNEVVLCQDQFKSSPRSGSVQPKPFRGGWLTGLACHASLMGRPYSYAAHIYEISLHCG